MKLIEGKDKEGHSQEDTNHIETLEAVNPGPNFGGLILGLLHHPNDVGKDSLIAGLCHLECDCMTFIESTSKDFISNFLLNRNSFTSQGHFIDRCRIHGQAVNRNLIALGHQDQVSDLEVLSRHFQSLSIRLQELSGFWHLRHEAGNGGGGFFRDVGLQDLRSRKDKEQDSSLTLFLDDQGPQGRQNHQQIHIWRPVLNGITDGLL